MSGYGGYRVKDRSAKVRKRREAMPVSGRSVFVLQSVIEAKAAEARRQLEANSKNLQVPTKSRKRHETFRAYLSKRNRIPAPTPEIRRELPVPGLRKVAWWR